MPRIQCAVPAFSVKQMLATGMLIAAGIFGGLADKAKADIIPIRSLNDWRTFIDSTPNSASYGSTLEFNGNSEIENKVIILPYTFLGHGFVIDGGMENNISNPFLPKSSVAGYINPFSVNSGLLEGGIYSIGNLNLNGNVDGGFLIFEDANKDGIVFSVDTSNWTIISSPGDKFYTDVIFSGMDPFVSRGNLRFESIRIGDMMGDANKDGYVDDDDLSLLLSNWRTNTREWVKGDFNKDGYVNDDDLSLLLSNWRSSYLASPTQYSESVPEPSTSAVLGVGALALAARRRRKAGLADVIKDAEATP